ncbi:MAG: hypothetical protein O3A00_26815, partial [Planctomycetota bacterium]|nr:hypothetical protein [Planctomycetota bacterium]
MVSFRSQISSSALFVLCVTLCFLSPGHAQPEANSPAPATLLPEQSVLYLGWNGNAAHRETFEQTAAYDALYRTGLIDVLKKGLNFALLQGGLGEQADTVKGGLTKIMDNGFSFSVALKSVDAVPVPLPMATVVLHRAGDLEDAVSGFVKRAVEGEFTTADVAGRKVTSGMLPTPMPMQLGWWKEADHLVITVGPGAVDSAIAVATGKAPNVTKNPLWKQDATKSNFEVTTASWFDIGALRSAYGEIPLPIPDVKPLTINRILQAVGLDKLDVVTARNGYKGRAIWSESTVASRGPKTGLLAFAGQEPMTLDDLPPLPFETNGFAAASVNWSKAFDNGVQIAKDIASLGPPEAVAQVEQTLALLPALLQFDPKKELLDCLGNVVCFYGDPRQSFLGIGAGLAISVKDPVQLRKTLQSATRRLMETVPGFGVSPTGLSTRITKKHGRDIVVFEIGGGFINPAFAVDDKWLIIGFIPQTIEAFLLRLENQAKGSHVGLATWKPSASYERAFAELPKEFVSISVVDPRKT